MVLTPPKPTGCIIEEIDDLDGRTYRWKNPSGGLFRYFVAAFLIFWLCGWAVAWIAAATELIRGRPKGGDLFSIVLARRLDRRRRVRFLYALHRDSSTPTWRV